jgi:predicted TIM-barrel fold metal-dependent hydrolase
MTAPEAAADELERGVRDLGFSGALINGQTRGRFLDQPDFEPILLRAQDLDVPIYIHPGIPPKAVREAYYDGFDARVSFLLATAGWGWHSETAVHILRLALSGTLERFPALKLIIGHMGEGLPAMLDRCDNVFRLDKRGERTISQAITQQVWVTTSGMFTAPPLFALLAVFGIDRVMFSVDYPYSRSEQGLKFLSNLPLAPGDVRKIAHENADRLLKLGRPGE